MPITFLHAADIHLDSPLRGLERYEGAPVDRIRNAGRLAFNRLIDLALEKKVDFVLIAGDLSDGEWRDYNTGLYLAGRLGRLKDANVPTYIISGNHDAANKLTLTLRLPDNVHVLRHDQPETKRLDHIGTAIHGQSFAKPAVVDNLAIAYPKADPGMVNIGLLHTALNGAEGHDRYAPCTLDDLRSKGYDYWALGHVHARHGLCNDPPIVFPGNIQGRHVRETGEKGCVLVTIDDGGRVRREFHRLDVLRWEIAQVDAADLTEEVDLLERAEQTLDDLIRADDDPDRPLAVRVRIRGESALNDRLRSRADRFVNEIRGLTQTGGRDRVWIEKVEIQTRSIRAVALVEGPIEEIQEVLAQLRENPSALGSEFADLKKKLSAVLKHDADQFPIGDPDWLKGILDEVSPLLFELLLHSDRTGLS